MDDNQSPEVLQPTNQPLEVLHREKQPLEAFSFQDFIQSPHSFYHLDEHSLGAVTMSNQSQRVLHTDNQSERIYNTTLLTQMNSEMAITLLPAIIYLVILMLVGSVGNFLVIYIFGFKLKPTTQNCLFMWLGVIDVISCVVGMPSEIVDISQYYLYENAVACKVMRFLLTIPPIASANLLVIIAIDRYRRVCKPLHSQMELAHARGSVAVATVVAVVVAGPALSLYGNRTIKTSVQGLNGCDCSVQDKYQGRLYPLLYEMIFGAAFVVYTIVLTVLYVRVWLEIRRHKHYMVTHSVPSITMSSLLASEGDDSSTGATESSGGVRKASRSLQSEISVKIRKSMRANKMTVVAVAVTVVFVLSYLPHLCLIILRTAIENFDHHQTGAKLILFNIFLRSYFLNSVANVFVYGAINLDFRKQCRRMCTCVKRSVPTDPEMV